MKLPMRVLESIRGPILAAALAGCASQSPATATLTAEPAPEPSAPTQIASIDPVSYDPAEESERFARLDQTEARDEATRDARLEDEASTHRPTPVEQPGIGSIGQPNYQIMAACGRG